MADRTAGYAYQLPQNLNQGLQAPQQPPQPDLDIGDPLSGLQHLEGVTRDYYSKWGEVQSFATNMWENFEIDVTKPDFRNEQAMEAHEIYNKAIADLRYQGDSLKEGQKFLRTGNTARLAGQAQYAEGFDPSQDVAGAESFDFSGITPQDRAIATKDAATQRTKVSIKAADVADERRVEAADVRYGRELKLMGIKTAEKRARFIAPRKLENDVTNTLMGNAEWYGSRYDDGQGGTLLKTDMWEGQKYGRDDRGKARIVDGFLFNPKTGEQFIAFKSGNKIPVNKNDLNSILETYTASNRGDRAAGTMADYLGERSLSDFDPFDMGEDMPAYEEQLAGLQQLYTMNTAAIGQKKEEMLETLRGIRAIGGDELITLPDGTGLEIEKKINGDIILMNTEQIWGTKTFKESFGSKKKTFTQQEFIQFLSEEGYFGFDKPAATGVKASIPSTEKLSSEEVSKLSPTEKLAYYTNFNK